jgi:hypothetical protein
MARALLLLLHRKDWASVVMMMEMHLGMFLERSAHRLKLPEALRRLGMFLEVLIPLRKLPETEKLPIPERWKAHLQKKRLETPAILW